MQGIYALGKRNASRKETITALAPSHYVRYARLSNASAMRVDLVRVTVIGFVHRNTAVILAGRASEMKVAHRGMGCLSTKGKASLVLVSF